MCDVFCRLRLKSGDERGYGLMKLVVVRGVEPPGYGGDNEVSFVALIFVFLYYGGCRRKFWIGKKNEEEENQVFFFQE